LATTQFVINFKQEHEDQETWTLWSELDADHFAFDGGFVVFYDENNHALTAYNTEGVIQVRRADFSPTGP